MTPPEWSVRSSTRPLVAAEKLCRDGVREGVVVVDRRKGAALRFFAILRPRSQENIQMLRLMAAFATVEGIRRDTGLIAWTRWPAQAEVNGEVVGEVSLAIKGTRRRTIALLGFSVDCAGPARAGFTSLLGLLGVEVDRSLLMEKILSSFGWMYLDWSRGMQERVRQRLQSSVSSLGSRVTVASEGGFLRLGVIGIGADGSLSLEGGRSIPVLSMTRRACSAREHPYL